MGDLCQFLPNYKSALDCTFMHTICKNEWFELSKNLCTIIHTMYKNNCVNFSNNSENLVLYRFNALHFSLLKWKRVKCVFYNPRKYVRRGDFFEKIFWKFLFFFVNFSNFEIWFWKNFNWLKCESDFFILF